MMLDVEEMSDVKVLVARVPTSSEAMALLADVRFRHAVTDAVHRLSRFLTVDDEMIRYLQLRYQQGQKVRDIQGALQVSAYAFRQIARCSHYWLWFSLYEQAPDLASKICSTEAA